MRLGSHLPQTPPTLRPSSTSQAGLSYWFSPAMKITASYRFDGYFKALKTLNTSTGNTTNIDRFYNGPMLRLTTAF
jgi:hypothetical protein